VTTPNLPASQAINDGAFSIALMPNRGRTRFLRGVIRFFLWVGALGCVSVGVRVFSEFHARHSWPVAQGEVVAAEVKTNKGRPGNTTRYTNYWVEYEVRFGVPVEQCLTGTIYGDGREFLPCRGIVRTRSTDSSATANDWLMRHPLHSAVGILHDPSGPSVKIVGESSWLVYPWKEIFVMIGWMAFFLTFLNITERRLQYLETLPEDYDASPPLSSQPPRPNDLIDMKLS